MTIAQALPTCNLPDHTQLPESDGTFVKNFQEHPQSILLTTSIKPVLEGLNPGGQYAIGQDSGIYWRLTEPLTKGAEAPDWFYVPNVPPLLRGEGRRSYVMWKEKVVPLIAIEFVSGNGCEERDRTSPFENAESKAGKFWVYEQGIAIPFYAIYEVKKSSVEVYQLINGRYENCLPNGRGHYAIGPMNVELGIWLGKYGNQTLPWLRWWDSDGNLLPSAEERADRESLRANQEKLRGDQEKLRAERLAARLREMGIDPDEI